MENKNRISSSDTKLHRSIETFLDDQSKKVPSSLCCPRCGSAMVHVEFTFFLWQGHKEWNIPLPLCPECAKAGAVSVH